MEDKELKLASNEKTQEILLKNLRDTQYAVTDLKINNHFLFNTLNSMASMAPDGGMMKLVPVHRQQYLPWFVHDFTEASPGMLEGQHAVDRTRGEKYLRFRNHKRNPEDRVRKMSSEMIGIRCQAFASVGLNYTKFEQPCGVSGWP